ncbi:hypothetical protein TBLA_0A01310 [Henningerozyma blattae CBS 6284]|uniref:Sm protein B n=1 Tax=Henningerozyma blattae (strain ATCC 34711 / CBS 6284 / DSM 70876 / NBRC 10599 / NRRL Y-10934 / UCD 77-7) TaxID=1071380 RepID=I2GUX8_HENB6|nr:hypothetical protein TBLA_0A01310 [Tetrapisispora blattae CBS 6284]CCH57930.1 hypothetical protein TBLA_0A01310 [Tetrapisispora blattae CBS 6284]
MQNLQLNDFINSRLHVTIDKDRHIVGTLVALDSQVNLLLNDVVEFSVIRPSTESDSDKHEAQQYTRKLGLVSIPRSSINVLRIVDEDLEALIKRRTYLMQSAV